MQTSRDDTANMLCRHAFLVEASSSLLRDVIQFLSVGCQDLHTTFPGQLAMSECTYAILETVAKLDNQRSKMARAADAVQRRSGAAPRQKKSKGIVSGNELFPRALLSVYERCVIPVSM